MFNVISKYYGTFNNTPPVSEAALISRDFLAYYSYLYYRFMLSFTEKNELHWKVLLEIFYVWGEY